MGAGTIMGNPGGSEGDEKPYEDCCHQWHACYQICGVSKQTCDKAFDTCSKQACGADDKCIKDAALSNVMMKLAGCKKYDEAQYQACECASSAQVASKREAAIRYFYKKFAPDNVDKAKDLAVKADTASKLAGLFRKLLLKYPEAIVKKDDPMKAMFDKIKNDAEQKKSSDEEVEEPTERTDEENIEL